MPNKFMVLLLIISLGRPAFGVARRSKELRIRGVRLCERLLNANPYTIENLLKLNLIQAISKNVFALQGDRPKALELESLERYANLRAGSAISTGNIAFIRGVPVVDAVYFPNAGSSFNISVKTTTGDPRFAMNSIRRSLFAARRSIQRNYNASYFESTFGVTASGLELHPSLRMGLSARTTIVQSSLKLLGFQNDIIRRPVLVLIDLSSAKSAIAKLNCAQNLFGDQSTVPGSDTFLVLTIDRPDAGEPRFMNLSAIQRELDELPIKGYTILFHDSVLELNRDEISLTQI